MIGIGATLLLLTSYYGPGFHGQTTASGSIFNQHSLTAAHKTLPFGTKLKVCLKRCAVVTVTDRGPYSPGRSLDVSLGTAKRIGLVKPGVAHVRTTRLN